VLPKPRRAAEDAAAVEVDEPRAVRIGFLETKTRNEELGVSGKISELIAGLLFPGSTKVCSSRMVGKRQS
jgi:hypothetical protein